MGMLFKSLCFAIFLHEVISDLGDDIMYDILSNRLDIISVTLSEIARKQEVLETKLEINENLIDSNKEHEQHSDTGSDTTESGLIEELSVLKKAISSEKEYVRNLEDSLEKKIDAVAAIHPTSDHNRWRSEMQRDISADQTDLRSRMNVVEKDLNSFESLANKMEDRIDQVETDIEKVESVTNFLENRTDLMGDHLESVDKITGNVKSRIESVEKKKNEIENKLETTIKITKLLVDSVETKLDVVELSSNDIDKRMDTIESTIEVLTEAADKKVSFSAIFKPPSGYRVVSFKDNKIIPFNHVFNNDGLGFNTTSGIFTVPVSGVYQFIFFVEGWLPESNKTCPAAIVQMFVDNTVTESVALADPHDLFQHMQAGNVCIRQLRKGQTVVIGTSLTCDKHLIVGHRTSFSGVLLY